MQNPYSIGIVTYIKRFDSYFKPLIRQIKTIKPDIEIIVCINGEYQQPFDDNYRKEMLSFLQSYSNIYPVFHPKFRGFSKLMNTCLINSSNKYNLILNDDVSITTPKFFAQLDYLSGLDGLPSFKINGSWSHAFLNREEVSDVGWFDERFLGMGEEDGDFEWRWQENKGVPFQNVNIEGITNHVEQKDCLNGLKIVNGKYSLFNLVFVRQKYKESQEGQNYGIMNRRVICVNKTPPQYPGEDFYWVNQNNL